MMKERHLATARFLAQACLTGLLLLVTITPATTATEASRSFYWQSGQGEQIHGLYVLKVEEQGMMSRVLADTPAGLVVLTGILDPRTGATTTRFLDPEAGWWAELTLVDDLKATNLDHYFERATQEHVPGAERNVELRLTTSAGFRFSEILELKEPETLYRELVRALKQQGLDEQLLAGIAPETRQSIRFLNEWLSPRALATGDENFAHALRPVLEVLTPLVRGDAAPTLRRATREGRREAWDLTVGPLTLDLLSADGDRRANQVELLSRFDMVDNTDPLSDLRDHPILRRIESRPH